MLSARRFTQAVVTDQQIGHMTCVSTSAKAALASVCFLLLRCPAALGLARQGRLALGLRHWSSFSIPNNVNVLNIFRPSLQGLSSSAALSAAAPGRGYILLHMLDTLTSESKKDSEMAQYCVRTVLHAILWHLLVHAVSLWWFVFVFAQMSMPHCQAAAIS